MDPIDGFFHVPYPCWLIVRRGSIVDLEDGKWTFGSRMSFITALSDGDERFLPVFTELDLAQTFERASGGIEDTVFAPAEDRETLVILLEVARNVVSHLVFDPPRSPGPSPRVWPMEYVIRQLQNDRGLR